MDNIKINNCSVIKAKLKENRRTITWLAEQIVHDESSLRKLLRNNDSIDTKLLFDISIVLEFDFFFCFSKILSDFSAKTQQFTMVDETQICKFIHERLKDKRRSETWLASEVYHKNKSSLNRLLKIDRDHIDTTLLLNISIALEFDFFCCFSEILRKTYPSIFYILSGKN
jgi:hypothetical protein